MSYIKNRLNDNFFSKTQKESEYVYSLLNTAYNDLLNNKISKIDATIISKKYWDIYFTYDGETVISPYVFFTNKYLVTDPVSCLCISDFIATYYLNYKTNFSKYLNINNIDNDNNLNNNSLEKSIIFKQSITLDDINNIDNIININKTSYINILLRKIGLLNTIIALLSLPRKK